MEEFVAASAFEVPAAEVALLAAEVAPQAAEVPRLDTRVDTRLGSLGTLVLRTPLQVARWSEA